jgi:hypothetical protein
VCGRDASLDVCELLLLVDVCGDQHIAEQVCAFYIISVPPSNSHPIPNMGMALIIDFLSQIPQLTPLSKFSLPFPKASKHVVGLHVGDPFRAVQPMVKGMSDATVCICGQHFTGTSHAYAYILHCSYPRNSIHLSSALLILLL